MQNTWQMSRLHKSAFDAANPGVHTHTVDAGQKEAEGTSTQQQTPASAALKARPMKAIRTCKVKACCAQAYCSDSCGCGCKQARSKAKWLLSPAADKNQRMHLPTLQESCISHYKDANSRLSCTVQDKAIQFQELHTHKNHHQKHTCQI